MTENSSSSMACSSTTSCSTGSCTSSSTSSSLCSVSVAVCPFSKMTTVGQHASFYTEEDGKTISKVSMTHGHTIHGITDGVGTKVRAIDNLLNDKGLEHTAEMI